MHGLGPIYTESEHVGLSERVGCQQVHVEGYMSTSIAYAWLYKRDALGVPM